MNSSDSGRPLRDARFVSRRSTCDRYRELYSCVRSSVTDSASARCTRSAFSSAIAPGSIPASSAVIVAGANFGAVCAGTRSIATSAPIVRPRQSSGNPSAATSRLVGNAAILRRRSRR